MSPAGCSAEILDAISKVCDTVLDHSSPEFNSIDHVQELDRLERRLKYATQYIEERKEPGSTRENEKAVHIAELYRLAGLTYLYRGAQRLPATASKVKGVVRAGYALLARLESCDRAFPVFILGCEARFDKERLQILDLIRRTQESGTFGNIIQVQQFVEAAWKQHDLDTENELDYTTIMEAVVSMSKELPCFV